MLGFELQTSRNRLGIGREAAIKAERSLVSSSADQGIDEQEVGLAGRNKPSTIGRDIYTKDRITKSGKGSLIDNQRTRGV